MAWRVALEREDGPVALLLSRQNIPVLDRDEVASAERAASAAATCCGTRAGRLDGAGAASGEPELILIATGAEVPPTLDAGRALAERGTRVRVVSMPCMELFEAQSQEYRDEVLPAERRARAWRSSRARA